MGPVDGLNIINPPSCKPTLPFSDFRLTIVITRGRALNAFAWLIDPTEHQHGGPPLKDIIRFTESALVVFGPKKRGKIPQLFRSGCHNNLAYYLSFEPIDAAYDVTAARVHLDCLKTILDRRDWSPSHPEYFHTEAHVEYHEFRDRKEKKTQ